LPVSFISCAFERVDNLGAYRIPPETGLLIPSVMTITHYNTAGPGDIGGAVFWAIVCIFCGVRLHAKKRWPF
jgi:hypothetical protein